MAVKLLMNWDILPGREQEYFEFIVRDFIPKLQKLGLEPSDAWLTMYGNQPQIATEVQMNSLADLKSILQSTEWQELIASLMEFVANYRHKIVPARTGFQM